MNVLWSKGKYQKIFSTDNIIFHASGDGATAGKCCRLCGGDANLKRFDDTYLSEGVEGRYDQLLRECFAVKVSPLDSLICEWCVRQLRNTEKFRALVYAAFGKPPSSTNPSCGSGSQQSFSIKSHQNIQYGKEDSATITYRDMVDLLNTKTSSAKKKSCELTNSLGKRANVQCVVCKQKYPYIVRTGTGEDYICSRCKKNDDKRSVCRKCNIVMPHRLMREHMELHAKAEMRRKSRVGLPQKPSPMKHQQMLKNRSIPKYKCPVCPKRYMTAQHLAEHIKCMHGKKSYCEICGRDLKNNETFEKHIKNHAEQVADYKCPPKSIRMKQTSKTHHVAREKRCD